MSLPHLAHAWQVASRAVSETPLDAVDSSEAMFVTGEVDGAMEAASFRVGIASLDTG